jgi:hypothetical protein
VCVSTERIAAGCQRCTHWLQMATLPLFEAQHSRARPWMTEPAQAQAAPTRLSSWRPARYCASCSPLLSSPWPAQQLSPFPSSHSGRDRHVFSSLITHASPPPLKASSANHRDAARHGRTASHWPTPLAPSRRGSGSGTFCGLDGDKSAPCSPICRPACLLAILCPIVMPAWRPASPAPMSQACTVITESHLDVWPSASRKCLTQRATGRAGRVAANRRHTTAVRCRP